MDYLATYAHVLASGTVGIHAARLRFHPAGVDATDGCYRADAMTVRCLQAYTARIPPFSAPQPGADFFVIFVQFTVLSGTFVRELLIVK